MPKLARPTPTPESRSQLDQWMSLSLALTSLVVAVTCSATTATTGQRGALSQPSVSPSATPVRHPLGSAPSPVASDEATVVGAPDQANSEDSTAPSPLRHFFAALSDLGSGKRRDHVHVVWLGDSHTAADLWTHAVRRALQERFTVGGPGFVHLGLKRTRHSQVKTEVLGSWQRLPTQPSRTQPFADGVFGLGGMRATAKEGAIAKARPREGTVPGVAHWSLFYRAPVRSSFQIKLGGQTETVRGAAATSNEISRLDLEAPADAELVFTRIAGMPELYGASIEGSTPGVVLDTLGIDGARVRTPLAWQENSWEHLLAQRKADLVVLAYGTNEVFESYEPTEYIAYYRELMGRVRAASPEADCWFIGPTDVMQSEGHSHPRVAQISSAQATAAAELGCLYVGAHRLMGGEGSYAEWQTSKPALAGNDGVHLTARGYQELGRLTAEFLFDAYERYLGEAKP